MPVDISIVGDLLIARGLANPTLEALKPNEQSYRALLLQPAGPILADSQRIGPLNQDKANERSKRLLALAKERGNHLVVTPEYFLPLATLVHCIQGDIFPASGALWVLGCESMTPAQLEGFKESAFGHCDVIHEEDAAAAVQGTYYDALAYCFVTKDADSADKRVVLFQFKTRPSRDEHFFENEHLRIGNTVYQFKGADDLLSLATIICSDAFVVAEEESLRRRLTDRATLIHIQLNPKPRHVDYRKYRTETFSKSAGITDCDILCLNWAQNIVQHNGQGQGSSWSNIAGSAWYLPQHRCSTNDHEVERNEKKGLYYSLLNKRRHVLLFHYDEAAFELTVPKIAQVGPAVQDNKLGPQVDVRFTWSEDAASWLEDDTNPDTGVSGLLSIDEPVALAFNGLQGVESRLCIERAISLSCGPHGISDSWHRVDKLDSCQMGDAEVVPRITFCLDRCEEAEAARFEKVQKVAALNHILGNESLPPQIRDLGGGGAIVTWRAHSPNTNVYKEGTRPALVVYLGQQPQPARLQNMSDAVFELLRRENGPHKNRVAVCYLKVDGAAAFSAITALTEITYDGRSMTNIAGA